MTNEQMSDEQAVEMLRQYAESKANHHSFFTKIIQEEDSTKVGNLAIEELGEPILEVRGMKDLEIFSKEVCEDKSWADYFKKQAEMVNATSLSKDGFLMKLSVTTTKNMADITPKEKKTNKGWFKKSE